jgi:hypothetical protein
MSHQAYVDQLQNNLKNEISRIQAKTNELRKNINIEFEKELLSEEQRKIANLKTNYERQIDLIAGKYDK